MKKQIAKLSEEIKKLTMAIPQDGINETPWAIFKKFEPYLKEQIDLMSTKKVVLEKTKNKKDALELFEDSFQMLGIVEGLVVEGYLEGLEYLIKKIPNIKKLRAILEFSEKVSRPNTKNPKVFFRGGSYKIYYNGEYYFKYWILNEIYIIDPGDTSLLFPLEKKRVEDSKLVALLNKAFTDYLSKSDPKYSLFNFNIKNKKSNKKLNFLFLQKAEITTGYFHKQSDEWIKKVLSQNKEYNLLEVFDGNLGKIKNKGEQKEAKEYSQNFYQHVEENFLIFNEVGGYVDWIKKSDSEDTQKVYVLRDTIGLYENDLIKDFYSGKASNKKLVLVNRDMLSLNGVRGYWWEKASQYLYDSLKKNPKDFKQFLDYFYQFIKSEIDKNSDFKVFFDRLGEYLINEKVFSKKKVVFVDTGIQGSVVMILCAVGLYLQDNKKIDANTKFDIRLYATFSYFKKNYKSRVFSDNLYFIGYMEFVKRQGFLYKYSPESFSKFGYPKINMGTPENQLLANIELLSMIYLERYLHRK